MAYVARQWFLSPPTTTTALSNAFVKRCRERPFCRSRSTASNSLRRYQRQSIKVALLRQPQLRCVSQCRRRRCARARVRFNGGSTELQSAWYRDQVAKFFLFDEVPLSVSGDKVAVSPIYEGFTINPGQPGGEMKFCTDPNPTQTSHNVVATVPGDKAYSPLWLRVVYDSAACASVHNLDTALKAKVVPARVLIINCPIVSIEH